MFVDSSSSEFLMKKFKGFKLGRRPVWNSGWVFRRRHENFLPLNPSPPSSSSITSQSQFKLYKSEKMTMEVFEWVRCLSRLISLLSSPSTDGGGAVQLLPPLPKGHVAVYVGERWREDGGRPHRYVVPVIQINHPLFRELLEEAEAEFGFHHSRGITIPCPVSQFERVQKQIAAAVPSADPCQSIALVHRP